MGIGELGFWEGCRIVAAVAGPTARGVHSTAAAAAVAGCVAHSSAAAGAVQSPRAASWGHRQTGLPGLQLPASWGLGG